MKLSKIRNFQRNTFLDPGVRRALVFTFDLIAIGAALLFAYLLRFDFQIPADQWQRFLVALPIFYVAQTTTCIWLGLYRGVWSFASIPDLFLIIRASTLGTVLAVLLISFTQDARLVGWSRSTFFVDAVLLILILGGGRFTYRLLREFLAMADGNRKKILVIGAGQSGSLIAREFSNRRELAARIVGFLDDNHRLRGKVLQGARIAGPISDLDAALSKMRPDEVIIAIPSLRGKRVKEIVETCRQQSVPCRICPPIKDILLGKVELNQLREVRVEDLLRRDVIEVDNAPLSQWLGDRVVMVTGGGGSIGSELCRQILSYSPKTLIVFDRSEYNLYRFEHELRKNHGSLLGTCRIRFVVGDILDADRLGKILDEEKPMIVLHAAAYKHVPLMETNIDEALRNNVFGTWQLARTAKSHGVAKFVLISTDKAVRPTNVMGATKRMAELVTHAVGAQGQMKTVAVRFGNVLDSEGSVLPLFRDQIARGGPVTVTHPEVTRYFMTIPEASQLVLQAGSLGRGGEVFLLDMGEPVLIKELAEELIKLSGFKPYEDINIEFTGLRPGEKLYEELLINHDAVQGTHHPKIMVSTTEHSAGLPAQWEVLIQSFMERRREASPSEWLAWIRAWVPEYRKEGSPTEPSPDDRAPAKVTYLH